MITNQYSYFLNQLRLSTARRRLAFDVKLTRKTKQLARVLRSLNLLTRFHKISCSVYRCFPSYARFRKHARSHVPFTRASGRVRLTTKSIRTLNMTTPHTHYLLETDFGVITHKEALRLNCGGYLLMVLH